MPIATIEHTGTSGAIAIYLRDDTGVQNEELIGILIQGESSDLLFEPPDKLRVAEVVLTHSWIPRGARFNFLPDDEQ